MISRKDYVLTKLENDRVKSQGVVASFIKEMAVDPVSALVWSNKVFEAAAKERVLTHVIDAIKCGDDVLASVTDIVIHKARYPSQSTSPTSNLIEQYELAAYADVMDQIKDVPEFKLTNIS